MCTVEKRGKVFILTITGDDEHRLNPTLIDAIRSALSTIRADPTSHTSALITASQGKFFSNGYDLAWARSSPSRIRLMSSQLRALVSDLISLPMPTIAAVCGHASAAGLVLALSHDYIFMRKDRGFLYMSEMDIGLKIPAWFLALLKCRVGEGKTGRDLVLRARKITAKEGVERGIVDVACETAAETVVQAVRFGEELTGRGWNGEVYSETRKGVLQGLLDKLGHDETADDVNGILSKI